MFENKKFLTGGIIVVLIMISFVTVLFAETPKVILFSKEGYTGKSVDVTISVADLSDKLYKFNDQTTSLKLIGVRSVALYQHKHYGGKCETITSDTSTLKKTLIGNNSVSSLKLNQRCKDIPGVILFDSKNYNGKSIAITGNISSLGEAVYNFNDKTTSIKLVGGASRVAVFEHNNYRGNCETINKDQPNLDNSNVGNNQISSLKINARCPQPSRVIALYDKTNFKGSMLQVSSDIEDLKSYKFNDKASSVRLFGIPSAALFEHRDYKGKCTSIVHDEASLQNSTVGDNKTSSVRLNKTCDKYKTITIKNSSGAVIRYSVTGVPLRGNKIVLGKQRVLHVDPGSQIKVIVEIAIPIPIATTEGEKYCEKYDVALLSCWTLACEYDLVIDKDYTINVSGTVFKYQCKLD